MNNLIIFDMDGVIFDSMEAIMQYQSYKFPTATREDFLDNLNSTETAPLSARFPLVERDEEQKKLDQERYLQSKMESPLFPGIKELIEHLHKDGFCIVLNTNAYNRNTTPLLEKAGIVELFDFLATRDLNAKKSEKFRLIDERYGTTAGHTVFVTDTTADIREAAISNVPTIAVTWGAHKRERFEREPFPNLIAIVDTIPELQAAIENYFHGKSS